MNYDVTPPHVDEAIRKRQLRRRIWERFEFAFFIGLMITLAAAAVTFMVSHLMGSGGDMTDNSFLDEDNGEFMVINLQPGPVKAPLEDVESFYGVDMSWMENDESILGDPYVTSIEDTQILDGFLNGKLEDIDLSQVEDFSLPTVDNVADLSGGLDLNVDSIYGTIRRGGRTNDVRTVYKYPSLVWGIFAED